MNAEVKKAWVAALRSGEYKQGYGELIHPYAADGECYCCLGVLCDLAERAGVVKRNEYEGLAFPPMGVRDWAGLTTNDPDIENISLVAYNDGEGGSDGLGSKSFSEIADLIEKYL